MSYRYRSPQELAEACDERKNLSAVFSKLSTERLIAMAHSFERLKGRDFTNTKDEYIIKLILDALGAVDWNLEY